MKKRVGILMTLVMALFLTASLATDASAQMGRMMGSEERPMGMMGKGSGMGMMGGMMGRGMGVHGCMLGMDENVKVEVKELGDGISITLRSEDKSTARRLQIRGEMLRLMQELNKLR